MDDAPPVMSMARKSPCRYGRGCTHINDPSHLERFHHPQRQELNAEEIRRNYMCNECGRSFDSLDELRFHLQKKTAWSNESLVGCRISCLVDCKEWHEGLVTHYHRSGKHCVEFRAVGEKRWFHMLKLAFYIIEPLVDHEKNEYKDSESGPADLILNTQNEWTYSEDISFDYAFTQSVLFKIYGGMIQETGHKTRGHVSLTEYDRYVARAQKGSLLYGELLPRGVNKALNPYHLDACKARVLFDMGMGTGKVAIQAFLQFRNLVYVYGVELSVGRYLVAEAAALRMVQLLGEESFHVDVIHGEQITITELIANTENGRALRLQCGNMMDVKDLNIADIIMMETDLPTHLQFDLCIMLHQEMHDNARILSYHDLFKIWQLPTFPFKQLDINCSLADRFPTSWSVQRGHHFFLFKKHNRQNTKNSFQRQLQRSIGRSSTSDENINSDTAFKFSSPSAKKIPVNTVPPNTQHHHGTGAQGLSEREYRESQAYATAFPAPPNETNLHDTTTFNNNNNNNHHHHHHDKEIPNGNVRGSVDVVGESSCGCSNLFSTLFCGLFLSQQAHEKASGSFQSNPSTPQHIQSQHSHDSTSLSPSFSTTAAKKNNNNGHKEEMAWTPKKVKVISSPRDKFSPSRSPRPLSPPSSSPAAQIIKMITSNSPRSVLVEQNKSPRIGTTMSSPNT